MKKILMVLIVILGIIIPTHNIYALEDSFYEGEYIPNTYIKKFKGDTGRYQQMKVFRRKSDNQPVYCIELWETLSSNKNIPGYSNEQYNYANIDYSVWERIMLISYYGYGYQNHTDIKWYAVTQFMIWQVTSPDSTIYFTDTLNGTKITKYQNEINEINNLIQSHSNLPSFYNDTYELNYKEKLTITDTNGYLDRFDITGDSGLEVTKINNVLTVKAISTGNVPLIFANTDKIYNTNPIVYIDSQGQDVLAPGSYYPIYMVVNFNIPTSTITVNNIAKNKNNKIPGDAKLEGAKFQLFDKDNQLVAEKTITKNGTLTFENIGYGDYYLRQILPGEGHILNNEIINLKVNEQMETVDFYNEIITNKISIKKYIRNPITEAIQEEDKAAFSIFDSNFKKLKTIYTDQSGYAEIELPYGKYTIRQERGMENHHFIEDFNVSVIKDNKTQHFELYNDEVTLNLKIVNTDYDSNLSILESGAAFKIKNLSTNEYLTDENNELLVLQTNNLGITNYYLLSTGKYQLEQIKAVNGYYVNSDSYTFEINEETEYKEDEYGKYIEINISNKKQKAQIEIEKYIEYYLNDNYINREKDNDISIPIYAKDDVFSKDGLKIYSKDEEVNIATLKDDQVISDLIEYGKYYIKSINDDTTIDIMLETPESVKVELIIKKYLYDKKEEPEISEDTNNSLSEDIEEPEIEEVTKPSMTEEKEENIADIEKEENQSSNNVIKLENNIKNETITEEIISTNPNNEEIIIEVPNTMTKDKLLIKINLILTALGLALIGIGKLNENN